MSWEDIVWSMYSRRTNDVTLIRQMMDVRDRYEASMVIPLNSTRTEDQLPPLAPQLIHDGIEGTAMRAAGPMPGLFVPAVNPTRPRGKGSTQFANTRRRAIYANWHWNMLNLLIYRSTRHLVGYGTMAMVVMPDFEAKRAQIMTRSPLNAYPEPRNNDDMRPPANVGFVYGKSRDWLRRNYGDIADETGRSLNDVLTEHPDNDNLWDLLEWMDEDQIVIGVLGPRSHNGIEDPFTGAMQGGMMLRRWPNRAGMCTAAVPRRITLDRIAGQMNAIFGMTEWLDRLMALQVYAAEKGVVPDMYAIAEDGREGEISGGEWQDGRTGKMNMLHGVKQVGQLLPTMNPVVQTVSNSLERAARSSSGTVPMLGGENPNSLRTGQALAQMGAFSVDPRIKEIQDILAVNLERVINPAILETERGYWPSKKYTVFSGWASDTGHVTYTPGKHFETTENLVAYAFPGLDMTQISVATLQLTGGELMSRQTGRQKHPMIDDPHSEERQIMLEKLRALEAAAFQQRVASGEVPEIDLARVIQLYAKGAEFEDAITQADEEARKRQAALAPPPAPGMAMAPESAPGLASPGAGGEGAAPPPPPSIPAPGQGQQNLRDLLRAVRTR